MEEEGEGRLVTRMQAAGGVGAEEDVHADWLSFLF